MNITELDNEILKTREVINENERMARELDRVVERIKAEQQELDRLSAQFTKEDQDVRRLEGFSLVGQIYAILGSKETRLEQERQELMSARLKYGYAQRRVNALESDREVLQRRVTAGQSLRARYEELLAEKERLLLNAPGESSRVLAGLSAQLADARAQMREVDEAVTAGQQAASGLDQVVAALESAQGWGTWDILGGGVISSVVKHSKLDEAHAAVQEVQTQLLRFERELADVKDLPSLDIPGGGLALFADIFVDGLLVDLLVQSRINESLNAARDVNQRVHELLQRLEQQRQATARRVAELQEERSAVLSGAAT
jgi:hypothetical protein